MSRVLRVGNDSAVRLMGTRPVLGVAESFLPGYVPIFMMHRIAHPSLGINGDDADFLRWSLEYLRQRDFNFVTVEDVARSVRGEISLPPRSVSFTVDDGYWDQTEVAAPIFLEFDCPATFFVTTGFIDRDIWFWESKVDYLLSQCSEPLFIRFGGRRRAQGARQMNRQQMAEALKDELKNLSFTEIEKKLVEWASDLDVQIPDAAPEKYLPTTWERLVDIQGMGLKVEPHGYRHSILSQESEAESRKEIEKSQNDLRARLGKDSAVFCYPVGREVDFGVREEQAARELGFLGAVSAVPGCVNIADRSRLYRMPRYSFPDTKTDLIQYASWIEVVKSSVRRRLA